MKLKTRNNFFMKYDMENQQARIKLLKRNYQLKLSEANYKKFKQIVYSFINQPAEIPEDWENDEECYSYLKTAMKIGLIYIFQSRSNKISPYLQSLLESNYENFYTIIEDLQKSHFLLTGLKNQSVTEFFTENGLMEGEKEIPIYFNDEVAQAPQNSLCVLEMEQAGLVIFNKVADLDVENICQEFLKHNKTNSSMLGRKIFPVHILLAYIENQLGISTNIFKFINLDGSIDEILPTDYFRKTHSYYQRNEKENLVGLQLISKFEQILKRKFLSNLSFNDVLFSEENQYAVSQYRVSLIGDSQEELTHYLGVGDTYVQAAERGIRYGIGEVLKQSGENELWISDLDEQTYYARAMLHFVPEEVIHTYYLEKLEQQAQMLKEHVEKLTENEYDVVFHSVLNEAAGWIQIIDQRKQVVYKGIASLNITDEIVAGFNKILLKKINNLTFDSYGEVEVDTLKKQEISDFKELNTIDFSDRLRLLLGNRKIEESIWLYETAFDDIGMFVGKFTEKG